MRGDLERIVLKSLEKDRRQRYQSAADLLRDIRHYLNREPIEARPPTVWTRTLRWVVRHPAWATTVTCLAIAAVILSSAVATAWVVDKRPFEIQQIRAPGLEEACGMREARLVTPTGRVLKNWTGTHPLAIRVAELVDRPNKFGGGRVIILGANGDGEGALRGTLCVFNADGDLEEPLWRVQFDDDDIPPELRVSRGYAGRDFMLRSAWVYDVFPDRPGDEIVAEFGPRSHSQNMICIYGLDRKPLYQVWHDGVLADCRWVDSDGLLVFAGDWHAPHHEVNGEPKGERTRDCVAFALRPKESFVSNDWIKPTDDFNSIDPLTPAWFLVLRPAGIEDRVFRYAVLSPRSTGSGVYYNVTFDESPELGLGWDIDAAGHEVPMSRVPSDRYNRNQQLPAVDGNRLPPMSEIKLVPYSGQD